MPGEKLKKLVELVALLRGPRGCPWDRQQDYDSLKALMLEEAYEVVDAVNARDTKGLQEELGDLLFLVLCYARMAEEETWFSIEDVIEAAYAKLVRRHPHVFGEVKASTPEEALKSWLSVKEHELEAGKESNPHRSPSILEGIAAALPATLEAYELGLRAAEVGFDWQRLEDLLNKIEEEVHEIRRALDREAATRSREVEREVGDLLFAAAQLARTLRFDPESALRAANQKFKQRFQLLEAEVARRGKRLQGCSLEELDAIWNAIKAQEKL